MIIEFMLLVFIAYPGGKMAYPEEVPVFANKEACIEFAEHLMPQIRIPDNATSDYLCMPVKTESI